MSIPLTGLVGYWKLDGNTLDSQGSNNGTPTNVTYGTGVKGQAAVFNGSTSLIRVANPANFRSTTWTVSAWVKGPSGIGTDQALFQSWDQTGGVYSGFQLRLTNGGAQVTLGNLGLFNYLATSVGSSVGWTNSDWRHIAASFDGSRVRFYFQGVLVANHLAAITNVFNASTRVVVGINEYEPGLYAYPYNGSIDELLYWNRALSDAEVYASFLDAAAPGIVPPAVTSVSPPTGPAIGGTSVTIAGTGFAAGATVRFGPNAATGVTVVGPTSITCTTPSGTGTVPVSVTNTDGGVGVAYSGFSYDSSPVVSVVSPSVATAIQPTTPLVIDVVNRAALLLAYFPGLALWEVVFDGTAFAPAYAALSSRVAITNGFRYTLLRASGWPASPTITAPPTD